MPATPPLHTGASEILLSVLQVTCRYRPNSEVEWMTRAKSQDDEPPTSFGRFLPQFLQNLASGMNLPSSGMNQEIKKCHETLELSRQLVAACFTELLANECWPARVGIGSTASATYMSGF